MNRIGVLEKVKGLLCLPNLEMATTSQVADFYGGGVEAIKYTCLTYETHTFVHVPISALESVFRGGVHHKRACPIICD